MKLVFRFIIAFLCVTGFLATSLSQPPQNPFTGKLGHPAIEGTLILEGYDVWGASVIRHSDGRYYMFVTIWPADYGSWVTNSEIALASSDTPEGPYEFERVLLSSRDRKYWDGASCHNPTVRFHKGKYYLFYIGTTFSFPIPRDKVNGNRDARYQTAWNKKRIGVAVADSPRGPWKRPDQPVIEPRPGHWDAVITSNPAPVIHEDGSVILIYKSIAKPYPERLEGPAEERPFLTIGAARADYVFGEYKRLGKNDGLITIAGTSRHLEDMYAWYDGKYYYMTVKNFTPDFIAERGAGILVWSRNATEWFLPEGNPQAYSRNITWANGLKTVQDKLERAQLLFENEKITHIFFANRFSQENLSVDPARGRAYNIAIPVNE